VDVEVPVELLAYLAIGLLSGAGLFAGVFAVGHMAGLHASDDGEALPPPHPKPTS
jgi:hypothetical protein